MSLARGYERNSHPNELFCFLALITQVFMLSIAIVMPCGFEFLINEVMPGVMRPRLWEVVLLPTWLYSYMAYVAMRTPDPLTREMLAYARLIIRGPSTTADRLGWSMIMSSSSKWSWTHHKGGMSFTPGSRQQRWRGRGPGWVALLIV